MATSTVPSIRNFDSGLWEYLTIREELDDLEGREAECTCDADEFHTCEICQVYAEKNRRAKSLIDLWGDNWAVELGKLRGAGNRAINRATDREIDRGERLLAQDKLSPDSYESPGIQTRHLARRQSLIQTGDPEPPSDRSGVLPGPFRAGVL